MSSDFIAGCVGGCAGVIVGHPLDTIKVHLQTQGMRNVGSSSSWSYFRLILKTDGLRGFYRGISSPLAGVAVINAIVFGVYGNVQRRFDKSDAITSSCFAGAIAGLCQSFITSPVELAKTYVQIKGESRGPVYCLRKFYCMFGYKGVFKGLCMTISREVPAFATYFATYEIVTSGSTRKSTAWMLLGGGLAGVASWLIVYPVDVIKTRVQMDGLLGPKMYKNSVDCLRKTIRSEGYGALFRGVFPTVIRAFPTNAACFTTVTWCLKLLDGNNGLLGLNSEEMCQV